MTKDCLKEAEAVVKFLGEQEKFQKKIRDSIIVKKVPNPIKTEAPINKTFSAHWIRAVDVFGLILEHKEEIAKLCPTMCKKVDVAKINSISELSNFTNGLIFNKALTRVIPHR